MCPLRLVVVLISLLVALIFAVWSYCYATKSMRDESDAEEEGEEQQEGAEVLPADARPAGASTQVTRRSRSDAQTTEKSASKQPLWRSVADLFTGRYIYRTYKTMRGVPCTVSS
jgi:hypothetical protein